VKNIDSEKKSEKKIDSEKIYIVEKYTEKKISE